MAQIIGKYVITNAADVIEQMKKDGVSEEWIKNMSQGELSLEVKLDGNKLWINEHFGDKDNISNLVLNEEVEDKKPWGTHKTLTTLDGNVLTFKMARENKDPLVKTFTFSSDGVEALLPSSRGNASRKFIYKRE